MTIHAFDAKGGLVCGLLFPSCLRMSSNKDMPPGDKVTTRLDFVDCLNCRRALKLPILSRDDRCVHDKVPADCDICVNDLRE